MTKTPESVRQRLFRDWPGCSDRNCIVTGPKSGMGTHGGCKCVLNASRGQLQFLATRLSAYLTDVEKTPSR